MEPFILSIDAGTTGITVVIIDKQTSIIKKYYSEFTQYYPQSGWVEHDAEEIWTVTSKLIQSAFNDFSSNNCMAIGITNQRETTLIWDRETGKPIHNAIVWQCTRGQEICKKIQKNQSHSELITKKTGLKVNSFFSASKLKWIIENEIDLKNQLEKGDILFGTIDTYLLYRLTGCSAYVTDTTNASRTLLFNCIENKW